MKIKIDENFKILKKHIENLKYSDYIEHLEHSDYNEVAHELDDKDFFNHTKDELVYLLNHGDLFYNDNKPEEFIISWDDFAVDNDEIIDVLNIIFPDLTVRYCCGYNDENMLHFYTGDAWD